MHRPIYTITAATTHTPALAVVCIVLTYTGNIYAHTVLQSPHCTSWQALTAKLTQGDRMPQYWQIYQLDQTYYMLISIKFIWSDNRVCRHCREPWVYISLNDQGPTAFVVMWPHSPHPPLTLLSFKLRP